MRSRHRQRESREGRGRGAEKHFYLLAILCLVRSSPKPLPFEEARKGSVEGGEIPKKRVENGRRLEILNGFKLVEKKETGEGTEPTFF